MSGVIATIVPAATAILVVLLGDLLFGTKIFKRLEKHDDADEAAHIKQSNEHMELKLNTKSIYQLSQKIESKIENIDKVIVTEKETKRILFENLTDKQKEMKYSLDKLLGFADEMEKVNLHNTKLTRELNDLQLENNELRYQNKRLKERIREIEHDDEYDISR